MTFNKKHFKIRLVVCGISYEVSSAQLLVDRFDWQAKSAQPVLKKRHESRKKSNEQILV